MHTADAIHQALRTFVEENFLGMRPGLVISGGTPLLAEGIIDSMGVLELLSFLEDTFGMAVADEEVVEANLGTLDALVQFVSAKQANRTMQDVR